jgi:hypothetical protein
VELYKEFVNFSKSDVLQFRKLEQQRKAPKHDEALRLIHYNDNQHGYPKEVHNIDSDGCRSLKNWDKNFEPPLQERNQRVFNQK